MNRLQLWKVVSVVLLACGLASAQTHHHRLVLRAQAQAPARAPVASTSTRRGRSWDPSMTDNNVFHGFQCVSGCRSPSTFTNSMLRAPAQPPNQGTITFQQQPVRGDCGVLR